MTMHLPTQETNGTLFQKKLSELTREEMRAVIATIGPKPEMRAGIAFLNRLLDDKGTTAVVEFVEKAKKILDKEGKLYTYDLDAKEQEVLNKTHMSRRTALNVILWGAPASIMAVKGVSKLSGQAASATRFKTALFDDIYNWVDKHFGGVEYLLIGAAILNTTVKDWRSEKLDEVANAVAEAVDHIHKQQSPKGRA